MKEPLNSPARRLNRTSRLQELLDEVFERISLDVSRDNHINARLGPDLIWRPESADCNFEPGVHVLHSTFEFIRSFIELGNRQYR
jgi:hypothetical protein